MTLPAIPSPAAPIPKAALPLGAAAAVPTQAPASLRARAVRSSVWTITGYGVQQALRLASNLILTRLLFPQVFGLMQLVNTVLQGLQMFSDVGISPSIIQNRRGEDPRFLNTAWTIQTVRGFLLWLSACLLARPMAAMYDEPMLAWLLPAAGLGALIQGFNSTAVASLYRRLMIGRITMLDLGQMTLSLSIMVIWAWFRPTVWALIGGTLVSLLVRMICTHLLLPGIRNGFCWDREAAQALFKFGRWVFLSTVLTFLAGQSDRLIFGKMIPTATLGIYGLAVMMATMPTQILQKIGSAVLFPAYSHANRDMTRLAGMFGRVRLPLLACGGLGLSCLIVAGPALIRLMYDARYQQAGWMVQILAAGAWFQVLDCGNTAALLALGATKWLAAGNCAKLLGMVVLVPLGYHLDQENPFRGAVYGLALSEMLRYAVSATAVRLRNLRGLGLDLTLSLLLAASSSTGLLVGAHMSGGRSLTTLVLLSAIAGVAWLPICYQAWRRAGFGGR
jgi:O-antigen/teichoic acid export membrane protein